jgi:DNA polymerase III epsilon subunit family exonuclease
MTPGSPDFTNQARYQLIDILEQNGPLPAEEAMATVLAAKQVPQSLAPTLMELVTRGDNRFRKLEDGRWTFERPEGSDGLHAVEWVVVDVETTGGQPPADRITELGAVRIVGGEIIDEFDMLVDPEREIPLNIQRITGITNSMVSGQPTAATVIPMFRDWAGEALMVAHNAPFDRFFIDTHYSEVFGYPSENTWLCSVRLARKLYPELKSKSLGPLCVALGIPTDTLHRAANDARATGQVLLRMFDDLAGKKGITDIEALFKLVSPTVLNPKRRKQFRGADPFDGEVDQLPESAEEQ